ncbi:MAG: hypothetical protein ACK4F9_01200 [Brevinematia bacterium]
MNFILLVLFGVLVFLVIFFYSRLYDEIKNLKGKGFVDEAKKEIEGLIVEFNKVSNRKILVIEEKIKELNNLIKIADERIIKLDNLTRNYAEISKRYEILKREIESTITKKNTIDKETEPQNIQSKTEKNKTSNEHHPSKLTSIPQTTKNINKTEENEMKNYNIEELDLGARAELLRKLIFSVDEDELIKMGFSQSEIEIAKIVSSSKR